MDANLLESQLNELGAEIAAVPRHPTLGFRGQATYQKMIVVAVFQGADGKLYVADPAELIDGHPDLALREWITVRGDAAGGRETVKPGGGGGLSVGNLIKALTGGLPGGTAGWLDILKGLFGK